MLDPNPPVTEARLRVDLAAAFRLVALHKWDDLIFTHLSVRVPGPEHHFLMNSYTQMFEEVTASSLIKVDLEGQLVEGEGAANPAGFTIHSAIHAAREDAQAVMHLHTPYGQAVSGMKCGLLPNTQTAMIAGTPAYHDYEGVATDLDERERLVADLGNKSVMLLRNHGTLTVGRSVAEAFGRMYFLERACEAQVHLMSGGLDNVHPAPAGMPEKVAAQTERGMGMIAEKLAWPALLRKLDRIDPGYRE